MIERIDNIILLGTSHVAKTSILEIKKTIDKYNPIVVGIELDYNRLKGLLSKNSKKSGKKRRNSFKNIKSIGFTGYFFAVIAGFIQEKIGKSIGMQPGIDMKTAYKYSLSKKIAVSLIDIDITITLKKLSKISFIKKIKLFFSLIFKGLKKENRQRINFDISKVPEENTIKEMINLLKREVPTLYNILIYDRNIYMSKRLLDLRRLHPNLPILAVVGAGHLEGMKKYLQDEIKKEVKSVFSFSFTSKD